MINYKLFIVCLLFEISLGQGNFFYNQLKRFHRLPNLNLKQKLSEIHQRNVERNRICYETVGCFQFNVNMRSPFRKPPEDPKILDTKFFLFRKDINFSHPQLLTYNDSGESIEKSNFKPNEKLKIIIHGYMTTWNAKGILEATDAYLKFCNCNVILLDWEKGARGPQYPVAAANTEVVGRQLGLLLLKMINLGLKPKDIHLIGFSLGAHVAGCASETIKKWGHLIGRITGLDAASPLFRHNHFREKSKKLDKGDAAYVDVIHTDASPFFTDGFGLLDPIGHVDFFPNGGFEQPGCVDGRASIVLTTFEKTLTLELACSHLRAWHLFLESVKNEASGSGCDFVAFRCIKGGFKSYQRGQCFPQIEKPNSPLALDPAYRTDLGRLGENSYGKGIMYLVTRGSSPFCGTQLQISIHLSKKTSVVKGTLYLVIAYLNHSVPFLIDCQLFDSLMIPREINGLAAAEFGTLTEDIQNLTATLVYNGIEYTTAQNLTVHSELFIDKVSLKDMYGNRWSYCESEVGLKDAYSENTIPVTLDLRKNRCD